MACCTTSLRQGNPHVPDTPKPPPTDHGPQWCRRRQPPGGGAGRVGHPARRRQRRGRRRRHVVGARCLRADDVGPRRRRVLPRLSSRAASDRVQRNGDRPCRRNGGPVHVRPAHRWAAERVGAGQAGRPVGDARGARATTLGHARRTCDRPGAGRLRRDPRLPAVHRRQRRQARRRPAQRLRLPRQGAG